jgi:hypothetical protein
VRPVRGHAFVAAALVWTTVAALLAASAPPWPDDWDGLGFLAAVDRFDMARFSPHAPGYPVYVAALRLCHLVARDARVAAYAVAVASAVCAGVLARAAARRGGLDEARAWSVAVAAVSTPAAWRAGSAIGSEGLAMAFVALAAWALVACARGGDRAVALGVAVGLGLGVRLSWAPLFVAMLILAPRGRPKALGAAAVATAAWAVPLVAIVGPGRLAELYRVHAAGHAARWGGTALVDPGVIRAVYLARDIFVDGLGVGLDLLGVAIGAALLALAAIGILAWGRTGFVHARSVLALVVPYVAWIALGQNVRAQPRHALPVVVILAVALALGARGSVLARRLGVALAVLVATRTATDAWQRRTIPPAGAQLVALVRAQADAPDLAVFGGPSARFFADTELARQADVAASYDEIGYALTRLDRYPTRILVTDEVEGARDANLPRVAGLCRPARLDRRAACLEIYELRPSRRGLR